MNRDTQTTALSDRESGTFLYEIDRHFNPYAPDGGYQTQVVFFLHGLKADKRFYYDHVLPAATIPEILHEHFRHQFDVIGYFGFDLTESAYGLRIWQGRELDRALRQEQASREPEPAPAEHPAMAAMQQDLWEEYDNTMARLPSEEKKTN